MPVTGIAFTNNFAGSVMEACV